MKNEQVIWSIKMVAENGDVIHSPKKDKWLTDLEQQEVSITGHYEGQRILSSILEVEPDIVLLARVRQELDDIIKGVNDGTG